MKQTLRIIMVSALATAAVLKGAPTVAQPTATNVTVVHTADLDLSTNAGRSALDHRLVNAAYDVCGTASAFDLAGQNAVRSCRVDVLTKARAEGERVASRGAGTITVAARR